MLRMPVAMIGASVVGAIVYVLIILAMLAPMPVRDGLIVAILVVPAAIISLIFAFAVLLPLFVTLRDWHKCRAFPFVALASVVWFATCFVVVVLLGFGVTAASSTAVVLLLPGVALIAAFWFLAPKPGA